MHDVLRGKKLKENNIAEIDYNDTDNFGVFRLFPTQISTSLNVILLYGLISSISFIFASYNTIYSLFLNGSGYPIYTCFCSVLGSLVFIVSTSLISNFGVFYYVPLSFILANFTI